VAAWTNATALAPPTATDAGILRPADGSGIPEVDRPGAGPLTGRFLERYWSVSWNAPQPVRREVAGHPSFHLTVTWQRINGGPSAGHAEVRGVVRHRFVAELRGTGRVWGAKFRPGGFAAMTGLDARGFTDRAVPLERLVQPATVTTLIEQVSLTRDDPDHGAAVLEEFLEPRVPEQVDPGYDLLLRIVAEMLADRSLSRVEEVAERHDLSTRALQRLFQRLVGVGPKWLLRRYRLHAALTMIDADPGAPRDLAGLAASLGWCDQSHFAREFVALVGVSPQAYARRALEPR
jgi:AraC-like DNA-binding protein